MVQYVAFLRAINVGGKQLVKMDSLRQIFESIKLKNVRTYIQSGNVVFETSVADTKALRRKIEKKLLEVLGHEVKVILTRSQDLARTIKSNPFKRTGSDSDLMLFVSFLSDEPASVPKLPLTSTTENLDVIAIKHQAAFIVARRKKNGWFGFPNNFVEKQLRVVATTRNWTTVKKVVEFAFNSKG